jgi:hypothetical protein
MPLTVVEVVDHGVPPGDSIDHEEKHELLQSVISTSISLALSPGCVRLLNLANPVRTLFVTLSSSFRTYKIRCSFPLLIPL